MCCRRRITSGGLLALLSLPAYCMHGVQERLLLGESAGFDFRNWQTHRHKQPTRATGNLFASRQHRRRHRQRLSETLVAIRLSEESRRAGLNRRRLWLHFCVRTTVAEHRVALKVRLGLRSISMGGAATDNFFARPAVWGESARCIVRHTSTKRGMSLGWG